MRAGSRAGAALVAGWLGLGAPAAGALEALDADEVVSRLNAREEGESQSGVLTMELIDRRGRKRVRETLSYRRYYGQERRTVIFFESPKNVKGTAFLAYDYPGAERDDDQWLYLPALRKVRRISASDRGDYFLGTDLTFEDMKKGGKIEAADYTFTGAGDEEVEGHPCHVVDGIPVSDDIARELGYGRVRMWIDAEIWVARRAEMWDPDGDPLKSVLTTEIRLVQGIWTSHRVEAVNHQTGHRSIFLFRDADYARSLPDDLFTERALRRGP